MKDMKDTKIKRYSHVELTKEIPADRWHDTATVGTECIVVAVKRKTNEAVIAVKDKGFRCYGSLVVKLEHLKLSENQPVNPVKQGDIFYSAWGYEQTNIDFYEIVKVTEKSVFFKELHSEKTYNDPMHGTAVPISDSSVEDKGRRATIKFNRENEPSFKVYSFANAYPWDGKPMMFSETH